MKLLLDENLPPSLTASLSELYSRVEHVHSCDLGSATDNAVWDFAKAHGFTIVSKDSDFAERSFLYGSPPKVIWIRLGNCSTAEIERLLRTAVEAIQRFVEDDLETCLVLGLQQRNKLSE